MDKTTHEDIGVQTERALTSPPSPKRPRTDCTVTNNNSAETRFDFPDLWTFRKTLGSAPSLHKNVVLICSAESGDAQDAKPHKQPQHTKLIVTPITKATALHTDNAHAGLSEVCLITAERHLLHLGKDEQPPLTETDKLSSYPRDDAGGALAESDTSRDTSADMSSHPDCRRLGKSLEHEPPGGSCLPAGNDKDGRQVQNDVIQMQAFNLSSRDEVVRCQSDCTHEDALCDAGYARSESPEVKACNQKKNKLEFSENIIFIKEEANSQSLSDCADSKSVYSNPEEHPSGNLADGVKTEEKIPENVAVCEGETKGHVNETGMSKNVIPSADECAQGSTIAYDVVLARNITAEKVSVEVDDFCGVKSEHAAGEMIGKARSEAADHSTETPVPARISREPTEGDNDPGAFSVIDPAMWSEADREAEVKRCNSESTAAVERSPSVKVCETETQEVSAHDQTGQCYHQSTPRQREEKEDLSQSYMEPQAVSIPINQTHNTSGYEGSCHWESSASSSPHSPTQPPPAGDGRHESHKSVTHQVKECFPVSLDDQVEYELTGFARMDRAPEVKEREDELSCVGQIKTDEYWYSEKAMESGEELLQQNEKDKINTEQISAGDQCIGDRGEVSEYDNRSTLVEDKETTEEKEGKEVMDVGEGNKTDVQGNSEILVKRGDDLQQGNKHKRDTTEVSHVECVGERTAEGDVSKSANTLNQVSQHEHGNKLGCFPAETLMVENKDDLAVFTVAPASDAVVPCQHDLSRSRNAHSNPTALNCNDRFSPVPSVFTFYDRAPGGFDTFEKIQLSPDDDGDDGDAAAGLGNSPLLTSSHGQLLETSERQLSRSMPSTGEIPGEEEVERIQRCIDNKKVLSSYSTCNELPNLISEADIVDIADVIALGWPEQRFGCDSACAAAVHIQDEFNPRSTSSTVSAESDSPSDVNPEFQMKEHFDMVLKELNLFFEISINDFASDSNAPSPEQQGDTAEALGGDVSNRKEHLSSPQLGGHRDTSSDDADEDSTLEMSEGDPGVSCTGGGRDGEQEVPLCSQETSTCAAEKHREPRGMEPRSQMWSPSFMSPPFEEQLSYRPPEKHRRLEPLRTCTRPIRVGLSKRAKTKHLHRPHPFK